MTQAYLVPVAKMQKWFEVVTALKKLNDGEIGIISFMADFKMKTPSEVLEETRQEILQFFTKDLM